MPNSIPSIPPRMSRSIWGTYLAGRVWEKTFSYIPRYDAAKGHYQIVIGKTGKFLYDDDDCDDCFAALIEELTDGDSIFFKKADYPITEVLAFVDLDQLLISGELGARIYAGAGHIDDLCFFDGCSTLLMENLELDGVKASHTYAGDVYKQSGVRLLDCEDVLLRRLYSHDNVSTGLYTWATTTGWVGKELL